MYLGVQAKTYTVKDGYYKHPITGQVKNGADSCTIDDGTTFKNECNTFECPEPCIFGLF